MKKITFLLILALSAQSLYARTVERILSESSSIKTALSINPDILVHNQDFEYAVQKIKESISLYFPNIDLNFNLSKFNNSNSMIIFRRII